ncbi:unnamed protein product [Chrysodeixis includens]|uniref:E3 ubiquitin-protein ligase Sina-like RING finger domain-containing protein n=1 Tax=Chrysodeixis includens TaxID=689277 RepID=A0A9P0C667_CHRIL|nr:unnamed protein product [Chrysodeixis includens]
MSNNKKESLKKTLGISEYPWSSDDDDNTNVQPAQEANSVNSMRRPSSESRPGSSSNNNVPEMPAHHSLSGGRVSPTAAARKQQARLDRTLFWSIINTSGRSTPPAPNRSRYGDINLNMSRPAAHLRPAELRERRPATASERPPASADIQRILAFKKLTRSLQSLSSQKPNTYLSTSRRMPPGANPSRGLFAPSNFSDAAGRRHNTSRSNQHHRIQLSQYLPQRHTNVFYEEAEVSPSTSISDVNEILTVEDPQPSSSGMQYRSIQTRQNGPPNLDTTQALPDHHYVNVDQSDDDVEAVQQSAPAAEQSDENNADDENVEGTTPNTSAGGISLEEEIVEVDVAEEPDAAAAPDADGDGEGEGDGEGDAEENTADVNITTVNSAPTPTPEEAVETPRPPSLKRKREGNDDNAEPYSVQEFNQNLLRLLECPVCLEWMEPPISQCRRGHLVCSRCRTRLASCPVCRTTFSSVRNRAMEGVAEMLRYPCRHGCGREVRLRRRGPHEASCGARRYHCPAPPCARHPPLPHHELAHHFQCKHLPILKIGRKHKFSMKVNSEQHDTWVIMALDEYFHLRVDVDIRTWGVIVYVAYIGPKRKARNYTYEVVVEGQHNSRCLKYARATHSDLESSSLNVSRQDCFHLTLDQALNFLRFKNRHCEPDKFLDFDVEISKNQNANLQDSKDESD